MGTSQSSYGSPSGVPLVPPWVPNVSEPNDMPSDQDDSTKQDIPPAIPADTVPLVQEIAPARRWSGSRRSIGEFANSGHVADMQRGVGRYVGGLGGARSGTRRFGGTTKNAERLYNALSGMANKEAVIPGSPLDPTLLEGRTAREVIDAVIETVQPVDGTQDAEASRASINDALSDLMERFPEADLRELSQEQRDYAIERFVSYDVYRRFILDVGSAIKNKAPSVMIALTRLREVKDYIRETIAASFRKMREAGHRLRSGFVTQTVNNTLFKALSIFEEYAI